MSDSDKSVTTEEKKEENTENKNEKKDEPATPTPDAQVQKLQEKLETLKTEDTSTAENTEVEVERIDESSPLFSAKSFEELGLSEELLKGVYGMKFSKPSKIQEKALPLILGNASQNLIAQAQSGSGKTAAFSLGILSRVKADQKYPQAVCICPARELALQIFDVITQMAKFTKIEILSCVAEGDIPKKITHQVLIGTPGKILSLIGKAFDPRKIQMFVLDEADMMLDAQGLRDTSVRIQKSLPQNCQHLLFSATYRDDVAEFANKIVPTPRNQIRLKPQDVTWKKIRQFYIDCGYAGGRLAVLEQIYGVIEFAQTIIFVNKRQTAAETAKLLNENGFQVAVLYGGEMAKEERDKVIDSFRNARSKVLITTNVLARGIDIPTVELVINYDLPLSFLESEAQSAPGGYRRRGPPEPDVETYIHRIGRAGRYDRPGVAINLVYPSPESLALVPVIEKATGREQVPWPADKVLEFGEKLSQISKLTEFH